MLGAQIEAKITLEEVKREGERSSAQVNPMRAGEISKDLEEIVIVMEETVMEEIAMEEIAMDGDTDSSILTSNKLESLLKF